MASPSELFSCVEAGSILRSPVNDSTAKTHWSFAKDGRFKRPKINCDSFYNMAGLSQNKNRKAGIGYGKKTDLQVGKHPHNQTPPPDNYNISSFVETNSAKKRGFSPGYNRDETAPMSYIDLEKVKVPGPGRYQQFRFNQTPRWSMRPKTSKDLFAKTTALIVPAPCTYNNVEEIGSNPLGKYHISKYPNSKAKAFNPPRSRRFNKSSTDVPGPGIYKPKNDLSPEGHYVMSKNKSAGKRTFMEGRRQSFIDLTVKRPSTPGPGSYRTPSDFGYYDNKNERVMRLAKSQMLAKGSKIQNSGQTSVTEKK